MSESTPSSMSHPLLPRMVAALIAMIFACTTSGAGPQLASAEDDVQVDVASLTTTEPEDLGSQGSMFDPVPEDVTPLPYEFQGGDQPLLLTGTDAAERSTSSGPGGLNLEQSRAMYGCSAYGTVPRYNPVEEVARDRYAFDIHARVSVGDGNGNIDWTLDPYGDLGWKLWFSSLRWLGSTIEAARGGDDAALNKATSIIKDWRNDHGTDWFGNLDHMEANTHRLNVLICYREVVMQRNGGILPADYTWLITLMDLHAHHNIGQWSGINNHGSMENRALLGYGCIVGNEMYQREALDRIHRAFPAQVDEEGLSNEAAPHYAAFNYSLFNDISKIMNRCGHASPLSDQRLELMGESLAHMTDSTGYYWEYGNSNVYRAQIRSHPAAAYAVTNGREGSAPARIKAYTAGPVFGRSSWGNPSDGFLQEASWTLRGGTGREHKAHKGDLMQFLYATQGRKVVVDGGFAGVVDNKWSRWDRSEVAHNVIHVPTLPEHSFGPTTLGRTGWSKDGSADFTEMIQEYGPDGVKGTKSRGVLVMTEPDVTVVLDRTRINDGGKHVVQTLWNMPPGQTTTVTGRSYVVSDVDEVSSARTVMVQVPFWGNPDVQRGETYTVRGIDTDPPRGFYFERTFEPTPIDQVVFSRAGNNVGTLSVLVPTEKSTGVSVRRGMYSDGSVKLSITIGSHVETVRVTAGGYMSRMANPDDVVPQPQTPPTSFDVYTTPGVHDYNGRQWKTACEPYSQTTRCRTEIEATTVRIVGGKYVRTRGWAFNNLTYLPAPRPLWESNPLAIPGKHTIQGRHWRTECDNAQTGRNGCRSYMLISVIAASTEVGGGYTYAVRDEWVFNNIVKFS